MPTLVFVAMAAVKCHVTLSGATVPIKFEVFKGATELTAVSNIKTPLTAVGVSCSTATADYIELIATGGTALRYDTTAGQYIYNWQTSGKAGSCYKVTISSLMAHRRARCSS